MNTSKGITRINHALKVVEFAEIISDDQSLDQKTKEIIIYTAILHDIGIKKAEKKYNSSIGKYKEIEGPSIAREMLSNKYYRRDHQPCMLYNRKPPFLYKNRYY